MKARDIMTPQVIAVAPDSTVSELAELLLKHRISAVPVIDAEDRIVGIVSEGDLIHRFEIGTADRKRSWWLRLFTDESTLAREYVRTHSSRVDDVMTRKVVTVTEETPLADIATLLEKHRIKRVPVVREGRLVGIVSRANLIQGLAAAKIPLAPGALDDGEIRLKLIEALKGQPWTHVGQADVTVTEGIVQIWGLYTSEDERKATRIAIENVPGVRGVEDHRSRVPPYSAAE